MPYATVTEAEARIAELEAEGKTITRDLMTHKKGYKGLADFLESKGFDLKGDLSDQWENTTGKTKSELELLTGKLAKMEKAQERLMQEKEEAAMQLQETTIRSKLLDKMKDVIGAEDVVDLWIAKKRVKLDNGEVLYVDKDKEISADSHLESYKKNNAERIRIQQTNGGQSSGQTGQQGQQEKRSMKMDDYKRLTDSAKKDFLDKGGELTRE